MKKLFILGIALASFAVSCKQEVKKEPIKFKAITETDKFGKVIGTADSSQWRTNDSWTADEKALFNAQYTENAPQPERLSVLFFANPCRGKSVIYIKKDTITRMSVRLVDRDFNVLFKQDSIYDNKLLLDLNTLATNDTFRIYYKLIDEKNNEFKGHGDIRLWLK
jgi:hypothetical protein